jgi:hypothetical protein
MDVSGNSDLSIQETWRDTVLAGHQSLMGCQAFEGLLVASHFARPSKHSSWITINRVEKSVLVIMAFKR